MSKDNPPGLDPLWLISLAMVLGTLIVTLIPISIATGDPIKSSDWIAFAGNVVAGVTTLIAATIAWFAVQRQIQVTVQQATLLQQETFDAISADLRDICEALNEIWRTFDFARGAPEAEALDRRVIAGVACSSINGAPLDGLELLGKDLTPLRRRSFSNVLAQLKIVNGEIERIARGNGHEADAGHRIMTAWIQLSHFEKYMQSFNPDLARIFSARQKSNVIHQNIAFHIRPFVNEHVHD